MSRSRPLNQVAGDACLVPWCGGGIVSMYGSEVRVTDEVRRVRDARNPSRATARFVGELGRRLSPGISVYTRSGEMRRRYENMKFQIPNCKLHGALRTCSAQNVTSQCLEAKCRTQKGEYI